MRDDSILTAIDEALDGSTTCFCGKELLISEHDDALWLECPTFAGTSRLPARMVTFIRLATHDRRVVAALPPTSVVQPVRTATPVRAPRPVVVRS